MQKFTSLRWRNLVSNTGLMKLGLVILACFAADVGRAQFTFATFQVLSGDLGSVTNDNTGAVRDLNAPNIAGFPANAPLWYQWTPTVDGEVELDTIGSVDDLNGTPLNTVLGVFTGTSLTTLNQVAANDDLFPINSSISSVSHSLAQINQTGSGDYAHFYGPGSPPVIGYIQPYYGPSHLRFNAKAGTTYYIAVDSQNANSCLGFSLGKGPGTIVLHWAYKSSGVFRFASEDVDFWTALPTGYPFIGGGGHLIGYPLYQTAQTESLLPTGTANDANSTILTYYQYNVPGVLVTVTRVAGSAGRAMVKYQTVDGTSLPVLPTNNAPAVAGVDYQAVSGTLVFDDYEMSKTILIPILYPGIKGSGGYTNNAVFGVQLIDDGVTSPTLDPFESGAVAPPRVDPNFSLALVKILNVNADPYGPDIVQVVSTNATTPWLDPPTNTIPNIETNPVVALSTNVIINFAKANYRVPADVNNMTNNGAPGWIKVVIYAERFGTNTSAITLNYRVNNDLGYDKDNREEMNFIFPLQPGSDYAVPTPETWAPIQGTNADFNLAQGTISFPASGSGFAYQPISFTVTNTTLTKFNKDFKIELYRTISIGGQNVPALAGMVGETTVTILFNDLNPPAGSVDEFYNADFNSDLAVPPNVVPQTIPQNDPNPGVSGVVKSLLVLADNKTLIAGDFLSYNGFNYPDAKPVNCIALINTNGALDSSFEPNSGASGLISTLASSPGGQFVIGGAFTSFNGVSRSHVARLNADGSLDAAFNPTANGTVWAAAVLADGKVLIGGDFNSVNSQTRNHLARLNADGTLDTTFNPGTTLNGPVYAIALPPSVIASITRNAVGNSNEDDQIINLGNYTSGTLTVNYDMAVAPDDMRIFYGDTNVTAGTGVLIYDTGSVTGTGTFVLPLGPINGLTTNLITIVMNQGGQTSSTQWKYTASVAPLVSASGIFVGGDFGVSGHSYADIARFTANGSLDTTFNPVAGADNPIYTLGWQIDGKVVVGGSFTHFNGSAMNRIARLNADGSLDTANFFVGTGANDVVWNLTLQPLDGTMYVGGQFSSFNGTHRLGFTRLYANGTVDTTFLDTAYNQFAGLKRIYSYDVPAVYASGVQSDGNVIIGGTFYQVGGGQADPNVCNTLDDELFIDRSFNDPNLWVEPKTRDGVHNRSSVARLIGGSTPGPGNIGLQTASFSAKKSQSVLSVGLVRTNGTLGPVSANFSVQPSTALSGRDFYYNSAPPLFWIAWDYITTPTRTRGDGLFGVNGFLQDVFNFLSLADAGINRQSAVTVSVIKNPLSSGDLNAQFQLANPSGADEFYLGGQNIPLGAALGRSAAPFTVIDDTKKSGVLGFVSPVYIATNIGAVISLGRSNGTYGPVTMRASTTDGTALAGTDYNGITNLTVTFLDGVVTNSFTVTNKPNGLISTNFVEKFLNLRLSNLTGPSDGGATFGLSNAVLRLINPNFQGYLTLSATNYIGSETAGFITFVVNRVAGSAGQISVQYATTNGTAIDGVDYIGATNTLQWNNGDASPRTVSISITNNGTVGTNKQFGVYLFNPMTNGLVSAPLLFYVGTPPTNSIVNATLTISNDNSYGTLQFSAPSYLVNENGGYATITVIRTGGAAGSVSVNFDTTDGPYAFSNFNYFATNGVLLFAPNQTAASFNVTIIDDGVQNPTNFYFNVILSNPTNAALASPSNAVVNIVDAETYNRPPGSPDGTFTPGMNGDVLALALQTNRQILVGGNFTFVNGTPDNGIARLNADGSLDSAGFLNGYSGANGAVQAVVCQTDGRVVIGGAFNSVDDIARNHIARLMTDGSLDTSFNPGPGADGPVYALAETFVNGVRQIYVGGSFTSISGGSSPNFARLTGQNIGGINGGALDAFFATGSGPNATVFALAVYPTNSLFAGKVLIGGAFTNVNGFALNHIARLNVDGSVDTNFDLNLGASDVVRAIVIQIDGRILIGGDFTNVNGVILNHIARLNTDGTLDANFTGNVGVGANGTVQAIAVQADNRIVLAGQFTQASGVPRNHITRLMPNGAVDTTINFGAGANDTVDVAVVQPADEMIVVGGAFTQFNNQPHDHLVRLYGGSMVGSITGGNGLVIPAGSALVHESFMPANNIIDPGETVTLSFAFTNSYGNDVSNLVATLLAINGITSPSPASNNYGSLIVGGPSVSRQFSFTASGTNGQSIAATFQLQSGTNNLGTAVFTYMLGTFTNTFANTSAIIINDLAPAPAPYLATPYPSIINVSGVGGSLIKVTVTFANLTHSWPADIDALLESPSQQSALLMANAGGGFAVNDVTLVFDDDASALPQAAQIFSGTYKPTAYFPVATFLAPAPPDPYATNLSGFTRSNPNGAWSLFVIDDTAINDGVISNGWSLNLITASPIASLAQTPQFGSLVISNGTVQFTVTSGQTQTNVIQASTNLINWIPIYTNVGSFTFTNTIDPNYPFRFYRDFILGP
jgi:uncharacterized delta-60 repeat protein